MKFLILASVLAVGFCDMMVGGRTDQDISDPKIAKEYLDMTFTEFGFDQTEANENVQLVKVQTQVEDNIFSLSPLHPLPPPRLLPELQITF